MDIPLYFRSASKSSVVSSSSDSEDCSILLLNHLPSQDLESGDNKKWQETFPWLESDDNLQNHLPSQDLESGDNIKWQETFPWLEFDENLQGTFCKLCKKGGRSLQRTGGAWITKPFTNWKKVTQTMKSHSKSEVHLLSYQLEVEANKS